MSKDVIFLLLKVFKWRLSGANWGKSCI